MLEGSRTPPVHKRGAAPSFVDGDTGAVGCGYYGCTNRTADDCAAVPGQPGLDCPSRSPYVIATGTTGAAFFAELYGLTGNATYREVAVRALGYAASLVLPSGEIPYVLDGANCTRAECRSVATGAVLTPRPLGPGWPFDTISYVAEGVVSLSLIHI